MTSAPLAVSLPLVIIGVTAVLAVFICAVVVLVQRPSQLSGGDQSSLRERGETADGTVLQVESTSITSSHLYVLVHITLRVTPAHSPPFESVLTQSVPLGQVPKPGDRLPVVFDPADTQKLMLATEPPRVRDQALFGE